MTIAHGIFRQPTFANFLIEQNRLSVYVPKVCRQGRNYCSQFKGNISEKNKV